MEKDFKVEKEEPKIKDLQLKTVDESEAHKKRIETLEEKFKNIQNKLNLIEQSKDKTIIEELSNDINHRLKTKAEEDSRKLREANEKLEKVEKTLKDVEKNKKDQNEKDKKVGIGISAVSLIGGAIVAYLTTGVISAAALAVAAGGFIGVVAVIISIAMEAKEPEETTTTKNEGKDVKLATQVSVNLPEMKREKEKANEENANEQSRMKDFVYGLDSKNLRELPYI